MSIQVDYNSAPGIKNAIKKITFRPQKLSPSTYYVCLNFVTSMGSGVESSARSFFRFRGKVVAPRFINRNNEVKEFVSIVGIFLKKLPETVNALRLVISCEHIRFTFCCSPIFQLQFCGENLSISLDHQEQNPVT